MMAPKGLGLYPDYLLDHQKYQEAIEKLSSFKKYKAFVHELLMSTYNLDDKEAYKLIQAVSADVLDFHPQINPNRIHRHVNNLQEHLFSTESDSSSDEYEEETDGESEGELGSECSSEEEDEIIYCEMTDCSDGESNSSEVEEISDEEEMC